MIAVLRICTRVDWKRKWFEVKGQRSPPQRPFEVALIPKYPTNKPAKLLCAIISRIIYFLSFSSSRRDFEISMASIRAEVWMLALEEPPANIWTCCTSGSCVKARAAPVRPARLIRSGDSRTLSGFFCLLCIAVASLCFLSGRSGCAAE